MSYFSKERNDYRLAVGILGEDRSGKRTGVLVCSTDQWVKPNKALDESETMFIYGWAKKHLANPRSLRIGYVRESVARTNKIASEDFKIDWHQEITIV